MNAPHHLHAEIDTRRTPLADALHTQRIALVVIVAAGLVLALHLLAACV